MAFKLHTSCFYNYYDEYGNEEYVGRFIRSFESYGSTKYVFKNNNGYITINQCDVEYFQECTEQW